MEHMWKGVMAALVTPMTAAEEVDLGRLGDIVEYLIAAGVQGLVPLGSTGEYYALSPGERAAVVKATLAAAAETVPVVVGVNAGSTRDVVAHAREAETLGADGVMLAAPYYSLPTPDELFEHFRIVDGAIGIPIMLYNCPGRTGVDMTPALVERLAALKNIRYIKESTGDIARIGEILRRVGGQMRVFCGCDTLALESLRRGAVGWVGGVVNVLPQEHVQLFDLACREATPGAAEQLYDRLLPLLSMMEDEGKYTQFVKAGCELTGRPVGPPRRPLLPPTAEDIRRLGEKLSLLGITAPASLDRRPVVVPPAKPYVAVAPWRDGAKDSC
jgi:4-hydroxy-tetrahydrodipicolinate synthase